MTIIDCIGNTPLVELKQTTAHLPCRILAKLEYFNPAGSIKDRVALAMIEALEKENRLKTGSTIIEPTSGNTGIGLALVGAYKGYRVIITMPDTMSLERRLLIESYGGEVVLTDGKLGMKGAIEEARRLQKEIPGSVICDQFSNPANVAVHYRSTGPEIWQQSGKKVDLLISGVGTGGTISGVGRYLKQMNPDLEVIAVEPASSPVLSKGISGSHRIQGIGAGFVPSILDLSVYQEVITIRDEEALEHQKILSRKEGVFVGISSGAVYAAALQVAAPKEKVGKTIVVIFPDTGTHDLS